MRKPRELSKEEQEIVYKAYVEDRVPLGHISKKLKVDSYVLMKLLKSRGIILRPRKGHSPQW